MRRTERVVLLDNVPLNKGNQTVFTDELQGGGGQGIYRAWLIIKNVFVVGTGTGAKTTEPELDVIKNIFLRSDKNEYFVNNLPARPLFDFARKKFKRAPDKDAFAAASATYQVVIPIVFADPDLARPEDTIIDTGRYESMTLGITMGSETDLLTTPGTASATFTATLIVERSVGRLLENQLPVRIVSYAMSPPVDLSVTPLVRLERADGVRIKTILLYAGSGGSTSSPFSGIPVNTILNTVEMQDTFGFPLPKLSADYLQFLNNEEYSLGAAAGGRFFVDFMSADENDSLFAAYDTAKKSRCDLNLTIKGGAPANPIVSVAVEQVRELVGSEAAA
jgi:hypothetical protein